MTHALPSSIASEYPGYLEALLAGDRRHCHALVTRWLEQGLPLLSLYRHVFEASLHEVGRRWERGDVSVATEHLATAVTEDLLALAYPRLFTGPRNGRVAVVTCFANEYHQVGARIVADVFELKGWRSHFLGASTPAEDVARLVDHTRADVLACSLTIHAGLGRLLDGLHTIRLTCPSVPILVGGQAFALGGRDDIERVSHVRYTPSLDALVDWLDTQV